MASTSLLQKAAKEIQSKNKTIARLKESETAHTGMNYGCVVAGSAGAAVVDSKYGDGEKPAETLGVPRNALIGLGGVAYGLLAPKRAPLRKEIGFTGIGFVAGASYRFIFDKMEEREAEKAAQASAAASV